MRDGLEDKYMLGDHSKSTFIEEGGGSFKSEQKRTGEGDPSMCLRSFF